MRSSCDARIDSSQLEGFGELLDQASPFRFDFPAHASIADVSHGPAKRGRQPRQVVLRYSAIGTRLQKSNRRGLPHVPRDDDDRRVRRQLGTDLQGPERVEAGHLVVHADGIPQSLPKCPFHLFARLDLPHVRHEAVPRQLSRYQLDVVG